MKHAIEYRLLQLVLNPTGDERRTLMLLHWDGTALRVARRPRLPRVGDPVALQQTLRDMLHAARTRPAGGRLAEIFPAAEGNSGLLAWSAVRSALTAQPQEHFVGLTRALGLVDDTAPARAREPVLTTQRLRAWLSVDGRQLLAQEHSDRLRVDHEVHALVPYRSPLSWANGRWHHTVPMAVAAAGAFDDKAARVLGHVTASIPTDAVSVVVIEYVPRKEITARVEDFVRHARRLAGEGRALEVVRIQAFEELGARAQLRERILSDIRQDSVPPNSAPGPA